MKTWAAAPCSLARKMGCLYLISLWESERQVKQKVVYNHLGLAMLLLCFSLMIKWLLEIFRSTIRMAKKEKQRYESVALGIPLHGFNDYKTTIK